MKTLPLMIAAALAVAANLSPAAAQQQPIAGYATQTAGNTAPAAATGAPHYEWQYHYVGRHPRYMGHWVLVR